MACTPLLDHFGVYFSFHFHHQLKHFVVGTAIKHHLPCVNLIQSDCNSPHIDLVIVLAPKDNLRSSVESRSQVLCDPVVLHSESIPKVTDPNLRGVV